MLIVLVLLTILATIVTNIAMENDYIISGCITLIGIIVLGILSLCCVGCIFAYGEDMYVIDDKIKMYQEENKYIEEQVNILVKNYMDYEKDTYKEFKSANPIVIANMFPQIKSDELVSKQLDLYLANNNKIKELKEDKINTKIAKWLLYFGK